MNASGDNGHRTASSCNTGWVEAHLAAGRQIVRLAIEWEKQLACILGDDLVVRRLRFLDLVQQEADDDAAANFDAEFAILNAELSRFIPRLIEVMGGLPVE